MTIMRDKTKAALRRISRKDLRWLVEKATKELAERRAADQEYWDSYKGGMQGMANVMAGVTWALACRASLRRSQRWFQPGISPPGGKTPASGEMWLPREMLTALRLDVRERQWSPLGMENAALTLQRLRIERDFKPVPSDDTVRAAAFRISFARETASVPLAEAGRYQ